MADPLVVRLANTFRNGLLLRERQTSLEMARRWMAVERALDDQIEALARQMAEMEVVSRSALYQMDRYKELNAQMLVEMNRYQRYAALQIGGAQEAEALAGIQDAAGLTTAAADFYEVAVAFDILPVEAVENIVSLARAGKPLAELLDKAYPTASNAIADLLIEGTALGRNPRKTAKIVVERGLSQGLDHILLVARDQQIRAYRLAALQQYGASGVVTGYRRLAAKNERTCMACLALDGKPQLTDELLALHPQDRCTVVPTLINLPPVPFEQGEDWFKKQSAGRQERMLGPGKYDAWKKGKFKFGELATVKENKTWGPSAQVTPLRDLVQ